MLFITPFIFCIKVTSLAACKAIFFVDEAASGFSSTLRDEEKARRDAAGSLKFELVHEHDPLHSGVPEDEEVSEEAKVNLFLGNDR